MFSHYYVLQTCTSIRINVLITHSLSLSLSLSLIILGALLKAHLRQESHNSKFGIFELLVWKGTFVDAFLIGIVSQRSLQNSPLESSFVVVVLIENYSTSKPL
jgi:hypothetical protein